jgi:cyclase
MGLLIRVRTGADKRAILHRTPMPENKLHRRDWMRGLAAGSTALLLRRPISAQQQPPPIKATKLSDNISLVSGDGGNIAVVTAPDGLLLIDAGLPDRAADLVQSVAGISSLPVRTLFNTHWHMDHVGANVTLGKGGTRIVAHENVRARLSVKTTMESMNRTFDPLDPAGLPMMTFTGAGKLYHGKETIQYAHIPLAHTDGDAYAFFPSVNVLHTGDLFFNGFYPVIDYSTGGWVGGMAVAAGRLLALCDAETRIIPGHGPLANTSDLRAARDMLETATERLVLMSKQGKTADEAVAAQPTKDLDEKWGRGFFKPEAWVRIAYTSVLRHNQRT